ncbi:MAG: MBL fold metallo-hydrolase [Campylobacteraceae bacterium]|jgi:alkyl sulfatase BDS1-like metallo-beta-lactamase superfamily hydrolase|nr:MBL fold metallo-hydrolase [Campylobacteraceae bacterium]
MANKATKYTMTKHKSYIDYLPFDDTEDFERAKRGLIAKVNDLVIKNDKGQIVWQLNELENLLQGDVPDTVNPSLWRHEKLNTIAGLFEIVPGIYQIRGFDLANLTLIKSQNGYIAIDPLGCIETAKAAVEFAQKSLGKINVTAIIVTHSHWDHFGGIGALANQADIDSNAIPLVVPDHFTQELVSENIFVGAAMNRRSVYQFGNTLKTNAKGFIGSGLGKGASTGISAPLKPNTIIKNKTEEYTIDGIKFVFLLTPDAEAPSEMCFYLPDFSALCAAEIITYHQHNILPFRGAQARSALAWSKHIDDLLVLFGNKSETLILTHHFPEWGTDNIINLLTKQRDLYKFTNDQTVRLINKGCTPSEIAESLKLPDSLAKHWHTRGYYGHLNHNVKAVYQRYLGWFDCNPANLNPLPPEESGKKFVELMGGIDEVVQKAKKLYANGEYRFAAQVLNHAVFGYPQNEATRELLANVYEQLGYQAESATWRNLYLTGTLELREGVKKRSGLSTLGSEIIKFTPIEMLFDYLAVWLNPQKADNKTIILNLSIDGEIWSIRLSNSVFSAKKSADKDAKVLYVLTRKELNEIALKFETSKYPLFNEILSLLERPTLNDFNIAEP